MQLVLHLLFIIISLRSLLSQFNVSPKKYSSVSVTGVEDRSIQLPCNMTAAVDDSVLLVLWFKEGLATPIYSYDVREMENGEPKHWWDSDVLATRAFFNANSSPSHLLLRHLSASDSGLYKCRVDFLKEPTSNSRINLTVIVPPSEIVILDPDGKSFDDDSGPLIEGMPLELSCVAKSGNPTPNITWYRNGELIASTTKHRSNKYVQSDIFIARLSRNWLGAVISCKASYIVYEPVSYDATIDMILQPMVTEITYSNEPISAGRRYDFTCHSSGSRPLAQIAWNLDDNLIPADQYKAIYNASQSISTVSLDVDRTVHKSVLQCTATNPLREEFTQTDSLELNVYYPPEVFVEISNNSSVLEPGDSLTLRCNVEANPLPYKVLWKKNNIKLEAHNSNSFLNSNRHLRFDRLSIDDRGNYSCVASNVEGDRESPQLSVSISFLPRCNSHQYTTKAIQINNSITMDCNVDAYPKPFSFNWFLTKKKPQDIPKLIGTTKIILYTPLTTHDFGDIVCYSENAIGKQVQPCLYRLSETFAPEKPTECRFQNFTSTSFQFTCNTRSAKSNSLYILRILSSSHTHITHRSIIPQFNLTGLDPNSEYHITVYISTAQKNYSFVNETVKTLGDPVRPLETKLESDQRIGNGKMRQKSNWVHLSAYIFGSTGLASTFLICLAFLVINAFKKRKARRKDTQQLQVLEDDAAQSTEDFVNTTQLPNDMDFHGSSELLIYAKDDCPGDIICHLDSSPEKAIGTHQSHGLLHLISEMHNPDVIPDISETDGNLIPGNMPIRDELVTGYEERTLPRFSPLRPYVTKFPITTQLIVGKLDPDNSKESIV